MSASEFMEIVEKAGKNEFTETDRAWVKKQFKKYPALWKQIGDNSEIALSQIITLATGENEAFGEAYYHGCQVVKKDLGYADAPMLERLLIDSIILAWVRWGYVECVYTSKTKVSHTPADGDYWERKLNAAQVRFLRALAALAKIRKLDLPAIQINIGDQQVNVVGKCDGG